MNKSLLFLALAALTMPVKYFEATAHAQNATAEVPLVARYSMEPDAKDGRLLVDGGPLGINGRLNDGAAFVAGKFGQALHLGEGAQGTAIVADPKLLNRLGSPISITLWVRPQSVPAGGYAAIVTKRPATWMGTPFSILHNTNGNLAFQGTNGRDWSPNAWTETPLPLHQWTHIAFTLAPGGKQFLYVNGKAVDSHDAPLGLSANGEALVLGREGEGAKWQGDIDELRFYAAALTPEQVQADSQSTLKTRAAQGSDIAAPQHFARMRLVRFDQPTGFKLHYAEYGPTRQNATRVAGADAVDWPNFEFDGQPVWRESAEDGRVLPLREEPQNRPLFEQNYDQKIEPGHHWLRAVAWIWGQRYLYTTDRTARTWGSDYELWTFPIEISGQGAADIKNIVLKQNGKTIYQRVGAGHSLTLLLPQNAPGQPYELSVDNRGPLRFEAGLKPVQIGAPRDEVIPLNATLPGAGPKISVRNGAHTPLFPNQAAWDADAQLLQQAQAFAAAMKNGAPQTKSVAPLFADQTAWSLEAHAPIEGKTIASGAEFSDGATWASGQNGRALQLLGGSSRATFNAPDLMKSVAEAFTFACWMRPAAIDGSDRSILVSTRKGWFEGKFPFNINIGRDGNLGSEGSAGTGWANAGGAIKPGQWAHVALSYAKGGDAVLYLNGREVARHKNADALDLNNHPLVLGYEVGNPGVLNWSGFNGVIDEAQLFKTALSAPQIEAVMQNTATARTEISPLPLPFVPTRRAQNWADRVGIEVPRAAIATQVVSLTHGMSGGFTFHSEQGPGFNGGFDDYAKYIANLGYDRVWEQLRPDQVGDANSGRSHERWLDALARQGVRAGLNLLSLSDSNQAFYSATLPDYYAPKYRDAQLTAARFGHFANFDGVLVGADNAGYVPYWDWAPPIPNRPWGEAFAQLSNGHPQVPLGPALKPAKDYEVAGTQKSFIDWLHRYDQTFGQFGQWAKAMREVDGRLMLTTGSFGSGPGVGGRGGWPWATVPGKAMFADVPILQSYDWSETSSSKPLHNVALLDRLQSYYPTKPSWALIDEFHLFFGREARQRAYALALTRGVASIGTTFLANPDQIKDKPQVARDLRDLNTWTHQMSGAYKGTQPQATIGVLYVHEQALSRAALGGDHPNDEALLHGSHEGKATEALFLCHAAGWPAKIVTPEELRRGLNPATKVLLLTGLNRFDTTWNWYDGLEADLKKFVADGGKVLLDDESVAPPGLPVVPTQMPIRAYVIQSNDDATPLLLARNAANIAALRAQMTQLNIAKPTAFSSDSTMWAVPHQTGATQYVTVVNQASETGKNASQFVKPQIGALTWTTTRPIYDVRQRKLLSPAQAARVDLTRDGFQLFALPPAAVTAPQIGFGQDDKGFVAATIQVGAQPISGIPVQVEIQNGATHATIFGASGTPISLPIQVGDKGDFSIVATELLSSLNTQSTLKAPFTTIPIVKKGAVISEIALRLAAFAARKNVPLVIALTPAQIADAKIKASADALLKYFGGRGRAVSIDSIAPNHVVTSLQAVAATQAFPRWQTVDADLILMGSPNNNLLLLDQLRGNLLPNDATPIAPGQAQIVVTYSPFVGERQVLNILADDAAGIARGAAQIPIAR